ncbi:hypothetical protein [Aquiflexum sp.]|uniref:hypothetical protein n=1 Tax=Aquiflexum sp. TaxID=1872584 RepID=UPI0035933580
MKRILLLLVLTALTLIDVLAQNKISTKPRMFFSAGFVTPQFYSGSELIRAYEIRQNGQSYFQNGESKQVGSYGSNTGFSLGIGYYIPLKSVPGLSVGLLVNSGQTGSTPSKGGYEEGYFFNYLNFGTGLQYYPFESNNLYFKGEVGMGSVFTKNRFINANNEQDFLHHFGIGIEGGGGLGYTLTPFKNKKLGLNFEMQYQLFATRVEVSGIGDDQWRFGSLNLSTGIQF